MLDLDKQKIQEICQKHKVLSLYLFGSFAKNQAQQESDIDFLVKFDKVSLYDYFDNYLSLKITLQNLFQKEVDLVEEQTLKNPFLLKTINQDKILIYG